MTKILKVQSALNHAIFLKQKGEEEESDKRLEVTKNRIAQILEEKHIEEGDLFALWAKETRNPKT